MAGAAGLGLSALKLHEEGAVSLQCANVRRQSAPLSNVLRFIARSPGRACVYLLLGTVTIGGALFSVIEPDADWFDGVWWTIVTLTTVGYGDYSPESFMGRWLAAFVMAGGIGAVAILTGILADEIREARILDKDETPELDDDIEHVMSIMAAELEKLQAKVSHPEVVAALRKVHNESKETAL
jgi:voltage-gated potassium channel